VVDIAEYRRGSKGLARLSENRIAQLQAQRAGLPRLLRSAINRHRHRVRQLQRFAKAWAGYEPITMQGSDQPARIGLDLPE